MLPSPRPRYFITRSDGTLSPLIAVDELPSSVRIVGVPAILSPAETQGMMSLGVENHSQHHYTVESLEMSLFAKPSAVEAAAISSPALSDQNYKAPDTKLLQKPVVPDVERVESWRQNVKSIDETQAKIDAVVAASEVTETSPASRTKNAATPGTFGKKVYCTHWIRWGECDYTQQGCLYKHEMPDEETLSNIGIRGTPRWYRDVNVPKPTANGKIERVTATNDRPWRALSAQPARAVRTPVVEQLASHPPAASKTKTRENGISHADAPASVAAASSPVPQLSTLPSKAFHRQSRQSSPASQPPSAARLAITAPLPPTISASKKTPAPPVPKLAPDLEPVPEPAPVHSSTPSPATIPAPAIAPEQAPPPSSILPPPPPPTPITLPLLLPTYQPLLPTRATPPPPQQPISPPNRSYLYNPAPPLHRRLFVGASESSDLSSMLEKFAEERKAPEGLARSIWSGNGVGGGSGNGGDGGVKGVGNGGGKGEGVGVVNGAGNGNGNGSGESKGIGKDEWAGGQLVDLGGQ
ncbi:hypothetical protein MMC12_005522 [Toensbergia leucococca]|nr:hypothetical protein [Toensbergia leucococca]